MSQQQALVDLIRVSKFLNKPKIILGMTTDEFLPAFGSAVFGVMTGNMGIGVMVAFGWVMGLKTLKRFRNPQFLRIFLYWFFGKQVSSTAFKKTIPSSNRFWLK